MRDSKRADRLLEAARLRDPVGFEAAEAARILAAGPPGSPCPPSKPRFDVSKPQLICVIGDAHCTPEADNERFTILGRIIAKRRPAVVVSMGDFSSLSSLGKFDRGRLAGEGQRYVDEVRHTWDALARIDAELKPLRRSYDPYRVAIAGNHDEERYRSFWNDNPSTMGSVHWDQLGFRHYGWEWIPFLATHRVQGFAFVHYVQVKGKRSAMSRKYMGEALISEALEPVIVGHNHLLDMRVRRSALGGRAYLSASAGCYFEHREAWAGQDNDRFDRGLLWLHGAWGGWADPEWTGIDRLRRGV